MSITRRAAAALLLAPWTLRPQTAPVLSAAARAALGRITPNALKAHVSFLASDTLAGRDTPSPGLDVAAEYIAAQFRRAGLQPAGDDDFFQTAEFARLSQPLDNLELLLQPENGEPIRIPADRITVTEGPLTPLDGVPAVRADAALTPDQARGKVLLVSSRVRLDSALQPALQLTLSATDPPRRDPFSALVDPASPPRFPRITIHNPDLKQWPAGPVTVTLKIPPAERTPVRLRNVVALLPGSDPKLKDTCVLLSAHYDHVGQRSGEGDTVYNGANDNASGTAAVLEAAAALSSLKPARSVVFVAFFGEEKGLFGSFYYARNPRFAPEKTVANLNLEQVGRTDATGGTRLRQVGITGHDFSNLHITLNKAARATGVKLVQDPNNDDFFNRSDNLALARQGVPAHTLYVALGFPDYHQVGDEWKKIDFNNMAVVTRTVAAATLLLANSASAPQWNAANPKTEPYRKARAARQQPSG